MQDSENRYGHEYEIVNHNLIGYCNGGVPDYGVCAGTNFIRSVPVFWSWFETNTQDQEL